MHSTAAFKYSTLAQKLRRHIASNGLQPGDRFPTEDELVQEHGMSRITIRKALSLLEQDGLLSRKRKVGTVVNRAIEESLDLHLVRGTVLILICNAPAEVAGEEDHALSTVLRGLERALADRGFTAQMVGLGNDEQKYRNRLTQILRRGDVEGVCAIGNCVDRYRDLLRSVPIVNSCTFVPDALPWVGLSIEEATFVCVGHMLDLGHRRVAAVCGPWVDSRALAGFANGCRRAHDERGVTFHRSRLYQAFDGESLPDLIRDILESRDRPTAIFGEDWRVCRAVLRAAEELNLSVPVDLSLTGIGQNTQYIASSVGITAYVPDNEKTGEEIGRLLAEVVDGRGAPRVPVFVPGRFIVRESVSAPPVPAES
ncbi:MAG TPA: substrate-binding domain-containing protein [Tepidisphaeraceae bacterium]|nr:substrate-binding domain-containing protein [Tepidisphaeraceae bacterium]